MENSKKTDLMYLVVDLYFFIKKYFKLIILLFIIILIINILFYFVNLKSYNLSLTIQSNDISFEVMQQEIKVLDESVKNKDYKTLSNMLQIPFENCKSIKEFSINKLSKETPSYSQVLIVMSDTIGLNNMSNFFFNYIKKINYNFINIEESKKNTEKLILKSNEKLEKLDSVHNGIINSIKGSNRVGGNIILNGIFNEYFQMYQNKVNLEKQLKLNSGFVLIQNQVQDSKLISLSLYLIITSLMSLVFSLFIVVIIDFFIKVKKLIIGPFPKKID